MSVSSASPAPQGLPYESAPYAGGPVARVSAPTNSGPSAVGSTVSSTSPQSNGDLLNPPPRPQTHLDVNLATFLSQELKQKDDKKKALGLLEAEAIAVSALPDPVKSIYDAALERTEHTGQMPNLQQLNAFLTSDATQQAAIKKNGERLGGFTIWYLEAFFLVAKDYGQAERSHAAQANGAAPRNR